MPIDQATGRPIEVHPETGKRIILTPGGLRVEHAPVPVTPEMRWWLMIDEELVGARDANGCYNDPTATTAMLAAYGVEDPEGQKVARFVLRFIGMGRSEAMFDDDEEEPKTSE